MPQPWLPFDSVIDFYCTIELKAQSMIEAQTSDITVCRSSGGGMPRCAWQLTASAVNYRADQGSPLIDKPLRLRSEPQSSYIVRNVYSEFVTTRITPSTFRWAACGVRYKNI